MSGEPMRTVVMVDPTRHRRPVRNMGSRCSDPPPYLITYAHPPQTDRYLASRGSERRWLGRAAAVQGWRQPEAAVGVTGGLGSEQEGVTVAVIDTNELAKR